MKKKILAYGEIIWDVYPDKKTIGGAPLNFAAHASLCGADSALVSAVGADDLADGAKEALESFGVSCRYVKTAGQPTGQCLVELDANGVPHYNVLTGVAYDNIELDEADYKSINESKFDALYFGTLIQRNAVSRKTLWDMVDKCKFGTVICDVNLRPNCYDADSVGFCLKNANILKVSIEEEPTLRAFGLYKCESDNPTDIAKAICGAFPQIKVVILTLGKKGSYAYTAEDKKEYMQEAIGDIVVSTVGAGDSFAAAFITSYLDGKSIEFCMKRASEVSGFVVAHTEAIPLY